MYFIGKLRIREESNGHEHAEVLVFGKDRQEDTNIDLRALHYNKYKIVNSLRIKENTYLILEKE